MDTENYCILTPTMQEKKWDVSIVMLNYNGGEMTAEAIRSIRESAPSSTCEIVVVDNGSSDGSVERLRKEFPEVRLLSNGRNLGFAKAVNSGIDLSRGRHILLLNNDTTVPHGSIDGLAQFMDGHPECGICGPQLLNADGSRQHSYDNFPTAATVLLNKGILRMFFPARYPSKRQCATPPLEVESVIGAALLVRREVVEKIGKLDERYFFFLEETDWCLRAREAGWKIFHLPTVAVCHLQGRTKRRAEARAKVEYTRSLFAYMRKHSSFIAYLFVRTIFPLKVFVNALVMLVLSILTLFSFGKFRTKLVVNVYLMIWLLTFCPQGMGLKR